MPGIPQLREAGRLSPHGGGRLLAMVRLEQRMDGSGIWVVLLNDPAASPTQRGEFPDEASARQELDRLYDAGRADGEWQVSVPDNPHDGPTTDAGR